MITLRHAATLALLTLSVAGCAGLPSLEGRTSTTAVVAAAGTPIVDVVAPLAAERPGLTAVYPLRTGLEAFAARVALIDAAASSVDVQYYIWHDDLTGRLMFDALWRATERGVRVRLLLDDAGTTGLDVLVAALDAHPNAEVRLFNPFVHRGSRAWGYLTDFSRLNRRMHNKLLTADGTISIVGGRNIGDEYFGAGDGVGFLDLDLMAGGAVVAEVATSFDAYWASGSSYPADRVLQPATDADRARLATLGAVLARDPAAQRYLTAVRETTLIADLVAGTLPVEWVRTSVVVDDPSKGLGLAKQKDTLLGRLGRAIGEPARELALVSPYFVPTRRGVEAFAAYEQRGVQVKVLTNALEATDVPAVHSGYAKHRKPLLRAGVELFETRRSTPATVLTGGERNAQPDRQSSSLSGSGSSGSSDSSLHAKTFAVDGERVFVGSFNFDPRSAALNTEIGFVVDSPSLASGLSAAFERSIPLAAYRVTLDADGELEWIEQRDGAPPVRYSREPGAGFWRRFVAGFLSLLPIDSLL